MTAAPYFQPSSPRRIGAAIEKIGDGGKRDVVIPLGLH